MAVLQALGGLGLFLLGMIIMTDGLKTLGGDSMRAALMRFTHSPITGAATGAVSTAILQSSSATTVAAVGFVGAGLLTFPQSLGIIFGANIGTTITGWLVALLGLKLQLGELVLPLVLVGAILKLFAREQLSAVGYALAGFSLIFIGITQMQLGLSGVQGLITPDNLPADTWLGRIQLVGLGVIATVITQSSSAGVAATLTLLYAGAIRFEQAAALVIGMDIGTTVTAAMAVIGGTIEVRRTGLSHVFYNVLTGVMALLLITPYILLWHWLAPGSLMNQAEIALVAFHSFFNLLGVAAVLPVTNRFAALVERLVPDYRSARLGHLDNALLEQPGLALSSVQQKVVQAFDLLSEYLGLLIGGSPQGVKANLNELQNSLDELHQFLDQIHLQPDQGADWARLIALMHALDHLQRLHERFEEDEDRAVTARTTHELADECALLTAAVESAWQAMSAQNWKKAEKVTVHAERVITTEVERYRAEVVDQIGCGTLSVQAGTDCLEAIRWLARVSRHVARIVHHLGESSLAAGHPQRADR